MNTLARLGAQTRIAELIAEIDSLLAAFPGLGEAPARLAKAADFFLTDGRIELLDTTTSAPSSRRRGGRGLSAHQRCAGSPIAGSRWRGGTPARERRAVSVGDHLGRCTSSASRSAGEGCNKWITAGCPVGPVAVLPLLPGTAAGLPPAGAAISVTGRSRSSRCWCCATSSRSSGVRPVDPRSRP